MRSHGPELIALGWVIPLDGPRQTRRPSRDAVFKGGSLRQILVHLARHAIHKTLVGQSEDLGGAFTTDLIRLGGSLLLAFADQPAAEQFVIEAEELAFLHMLS